MTVAPAGDVAVEPLLCHACGSPVPLRAGHHVTCPACRASVAIPARYQALWAERGLADAARHELETRYASAARVPARWVDRLAVALVLALPALAVVAWMSVAARSPDSVTLFTEAIVPAMLPGTALWLWSGAVHATIVRFQLALAARAPADDGGPSRCRHCFAPLDVPADAVLVRCAYCGTDHLRSDVTAATRRAELAVGAELRTLDQATVALRRRRRLIVAGSLVAVAVFALALWAAGFAYAHTTDPTS